MQFGIIGAGLIGNKRAKVITELGHSVVSVFDTDLERATLLYEKWTKQWGGHVYSAAEELIQDCKTQAVVIATPPQFSVPLAIKALRANKPVLVEKPAGRNPQELSLLVRESNQASVPCRIGFNHRFHPGLSRMNEIIKLKEMGSLFYFRARYGHGGRRGYEKEWRAFREFGGGGELLDQGVHLIDLCRWMGGEFEIEYGTAFTSYWEMEVEDNGFLVLRSSDGKSRAFLQASCTEWKNLFDFEVFFSRGKLEVTGLGGSYGQEELKIFKRKESGAPDCEIEKFDDQESSWKEELMAFIKETKGIKTHLARPQDALRAVELVYAVYAQSGSLRH